MHICIQTKRKTGETLSLLPLTVNSPEFSLIFVAFPKFPEFWKLNGNWKWKLLSKVFPDFQSGWEPCVYEQPHRLVICSFQRTPHSWLWVPMSRYLTVIFPSGSSYVMLCLHCPLWNHRRLSSSSDIIFCPNSGPLLQMATGLPSIGSQVRPPNE